MRIETCAKVLAGALHARDSTKVELFLQRIRERANKAPYRYKSVLVISLTLRETFLGPI